MIQIDKEQPIHNGMLIVMNINLVTGEKEQESVRLAIDFAHADGDAVVFLSETIENMPDWIELIEGMDYFIPSCRIGIPKMEFKDESFIQPLYSKILEERLVLLTNSETKLSGVCIIGGSRKFFKDRSFKL